MPTEPIISVSNVTKTYRIWENPANRVFSSLWRAMANLGPLDSRWNSAVSRKATRLYRDFNALHHVSMEVRKGESIGIIGRNGSGKSTLLQIIAGTLQATEGSVKISGRIAALLELGSGFNPDFTGKENVFLNAAVLGLSRRQIEARYDAISEFAEIGEFIDEPVKTYSSGMVVRLAFAVAVHLDPDILIVDEALAVGDIYFRQRCMRKIHELRSRGVTIVYVTHDVSDVKALGDRTLWLREGRVVETGDAREVALKYMAASGRIPSSNARKWLPRAGRARRTGRKR